MQSKLEDCHSSMASDHHWRRLVLDFDELIEAIYNNDVGGLIRQVLKVEYSKFRTIDVMVLEYCKLVMMAVAKALKKGMPNKSPLVIVFRHDIVVRVEKLAEHFGNPINAEYWVGEAPPTSGGW